MSRTRKTAIAAVLVAGLSGAITIAGISAASSEPGSAPGITQSDDHGSMDAGDLADCEKYAEENGMGDHGDMGDFMGGSWSDMMGDNAGDMMGGSWSGQMGGAGRMGA